MYISRFKTTDLEDTGYLRTFHYIPWIHNTTKNTKGLNINLKIYIKIKIILSIKEL